jgi:hypothetical protein
MLASSGPHNCGTYWSCPGFVDTVAMRQVLLRCAGARTWQGWMPTTPVNANSARRQKGAAGGHLRQHRADPEADRGGAWIPHRLREHPQWNYAVVETHKVSQGPVGVGTIYQQVRSVPSRSEERFEVTAHNPPRQLEIQGQLGPFPSRLSYALDAVPEEPGSRARSSSTSGSPGRLLGRVAVSRVRDAVAANLRKLKELLERQGQARPSVHTCSPVLLLIVARVLWTARPPARPVLGAEATMADPAGPMTFRCPLAVRSTCPPACCTAATISLASLDRQRFGVACFFSAIPDDLSIRP